DDAQGIDTSHEYIDGVRCNAGFVSTFLLRSNEVTSSHVMDPRIFVTDHRLERAKQLVPVLAACVAAGEHNLFIVAPQMSDAAIGMLVDTSENRVMDIVVWM